MLASGELSRHNRIAMNSSRLRMASMSVDWSAMSKSMAGGGPGNGGSADRWPTERDSFGSLSTVADSAIAADFGADTEGLAVVGS